MHRVVNTYRFTGKEVSPISTVYDDRAISELAFLPSILGDYLKIAPSQYLTGFEIIEHEISSNLVFSCHVNPGCLILNRNLIFVKTDLELTVQLDSDWPLTDGFIILDITYNNETRSYIFSLFFVDNNGNIYPSDTEFDIDDEHIILGVFQIKIVNGNYGSINITPNFIRRYINIKGRAFLVYGYILYGTSISEVQEHISAILQGVYPIVIEQSGDLIYISLDKIDQARVEYQPQNYSVLDNTLASHLLAIDQKLGQLLQTDIVMEDDSIQQDGIGKYIELDYAPDTSRFLTFRIHVKSGTILYPNIDFTLDGNKIRFKPEVPLDAGEEVTAIYYTTP